MSDLKIDEVLSKLNFLIKKSITAMQASIDNFNERISGVKNKITNLESVEEIKATIADYDMRNDLQAKTDAALDTLKNRCDDIQDYKQKTNHRSKIDALLNEFYSKKLTF